MPGVHSREKRSLVQTLLLVLTLGLLSISQAWSHSSSTSYLDLSTVSDGTTTIRVDLPLRDLSLRFDFDQDRDGAIRWREITAQRDAVTSWVAQGLRIQRASNDCVLGNLDWGAAAYGEENYVSLVAPVRCPAASTGDPYTLRYTLFFDQDALHRGLIKATLDNKIISAVASPDRPEHQLDPNASNFLSVVGTYLIEGVWHIWIGADHILFLISLLLPCVFLRESAQLGHWRPIPQVRPALTNVVAVVTAFTVAHSITLGLTVLNVITPPDGIVEPIIAASVIFAALGNLTKVLIHLRWQIALVFGLIHGFGFASVLADLGLPSEQLTAALLGFNIGVELGQLAIVAVFFPIAWALRATPLYRWGFVFGGSLLIAAIALLWLIERLS